PMGDNQPKAEVRMPANNSVAPQPSGPASEQPPPISRLPGLEEVKRINVAVTPAMVAAIQLVMTTRRVSLTEAVRRLIGYGDLFYRAVTERGEDVLLRTGDTTRLVLPVSDVAGCRGESVDEHEKPEIAGRRVPDEYFRVKSSARVWNYWLGGKDNYEVDRAAGEEYIRLFPEIVYPARQARQFLIRAVTYLAGEAGVRQFLDIGTGLPTMRNTHEVAQEIAPQSKVVYVDNDPVVLAHARALLTPTTDEGVVGYLDADVRDPDRILAGASTVLDFGEPVAVMLLGILGHAAATAEQMHTITGRLMAAVAAGSYLVVSDGVDIGHQGQRQAAALHRYHLRTLEEFGACFTGLQLIDPGLVPINSWRPGLAEIGHSGPLVNSRVGLGRKS
ncbi:MAG TPA: SAM-dependent methyltransferase, partial [Pseudonocardiaceae bacterium]|nr:SAM-dependent methyltransferase [Pseudonocardiaceae bacterium]